MTGKHEITRIPVEVQKAGQYEVVVSAEIVEVGPPPPQVYNIRSTQEFRELQPQLLPGDTVVFFEGTYERLSVQGLRGTDEQPICLYAAVDVNGVFENVIFDAQGKDWNSGGGPALYFENCEYLEVQGLCAANSGNEGLVLDNSPHVRLYKCHAFNNKISGIQFINYSSNCKAILCTARNNDEEGLDIEDGCEDMLIKDCVCNDNGKAGFDIACELTGSPVRNVVYTNCIATGNGTVDPTAGNGFTIYQGAENITYLSCVANNNLGYGIEIQSGSVLEDGKIYVKGCTLKNNHNRGIQISSGIVSLANNLSIDAGWNQQIDIRNALVSQAVGNMYHRTGGVVRCRLNGVTYTDTDAWMAALQEAYPEAEVANEILETV